MFAQDDWKVSQRLTLNLGLRWEFNSPPVDAHDSMSAFNLATGTVSQVGTNGLSRSGLSPDYTNFGPRVGFDIFSTRIPCFAAAMASFTTPAC